MSTLRRVNLFAQRQTPPVPVSLSFSEGAVEVIVRNGEVGEATRGLRRRARTTSSSPSTRAICWTASRPWRREGGLQAQRGAQAWPHSAGEDGEEEPDFLYLIMPMRDPSLS